MKQPLLAALLLSASPLLAVEMSNPGDNEIRVFGEKPLPDIDFMSVEAR